MLARVKTEKYANLNWYRFTRQGNAFLGKDIQLGKDLFTTGSNIDSKLKNNLITDITGSSELI